MISRSALLRLDAPRRMDGGMYGDGSRSDAEMEKEGTGAFETRNGARSLYLYR